MRAPVSAGVRPGGVLHTGALLVGALFVGVLFIGVSGCTRVDAPAATAAADTTSGGVAPAPPASAVDADPAAALVGRTMPPALDGLVEIAGACVGEPAAPCAVGVATLAPDAGAAATRIVARTSAGEADGVPRWTVTDALVAPDMPEGASLEIAGCRVDGIAAPTVVAVARFTDGAGFSDDILWSRRVGADGRFAPVADGTMVDCADPAAGL